MDEWQAWGRQCERSRKFVAALRAAADRHEAFMLALTEEMSDVPDARLMQAEVPPAQ